MCNLRNELSEILRKCGITDSSFLVATTEYMIANGVVIEKCNRDCANCFKTKLVNRQTEQDWIPVTQGMPPERESIVRGLGTVSKPVLVTWVDPTSDKPFPDDRFVREGISRNGEFTISHINGDLVPVAWKPLPKPYKSTREVPDDGI